MRQLEVELTDRRLRFDGVSIIQPEEVARYLLLGASPDQLRVTGLNEDIEIFNQNADATIQVAGDEPVQLSYRWILPEPYLSMDLRATVVARAVDRLLQLNYPEDIQLKAAERIQVEFEEIEKRGMVEFMKTIIYVLDVFKKDGVVWGVGRGSSCACYILFILGLHSVDCVLYNIPMEEFFHD